MKELTAKNMPNVTCAPKRKVEYYFARDFNSTLREKTGTRRPTGQNLSLVAAYAIAGRCMQQGERLLRLNSLAPHFHPDGCVCTRANAEGRIANMELTF